MTGYKNVILVFLFLAFFFDTQSGNAQTCYNGVKPRKPYFEVWGYPRSVKMNQLELERGSPWHFGFSLGLNSFDFTKITPSGQTVNVPGQGNLILRADIKQLKPGFNINIIVDYRLLPNLNLRTLPGISFGSRQLDYYREDTQSLLFSMPIASNYVEVPILLKYSAVRYTNFRPYLIGGGNVRMNLSSKINEDAERYVGLQKFEPFVEFGFGFDFYLKYFRLSTEIKMSKGLFNSLSNQVAPNYPYYRNALKSMQSNMLIFSLHFEG